MHHHIAPYVAERQRERLESVEHLVRRAADGDERAWSALVTRFKPRIRAVTREYRLNAHDAEDVTQATLLQLVMNIRRLREPGKLGAYLHTTARRISLATALRSRRAAQVDPWSEIESLATEEQGPEAHTEARELADTVQAAVEALPDHQRRLLTLMLGDPEPSYAAVADALDIPIGSIGPTRARSFERLRQDPRLVALAQA